MAKLIIYSENPEKPINLFRTINTELEEIYENEDGLKIDKNEEKNIFIYITDIITMACTSNNNDSWTEIGTKNDIYKVKISDEEFESLRKQLKFEFDNVWGIYC